MLAGELIDLLDPRPGQTAIDCTFGGGGHAELIAGRLGSEGTFIGIDRDPLAAERFEELAEEVSCSVRFIHASYADALEQLVEEGVKADIATSTWGCPRCRWTRASAASPTPSRRRWTCGWTLSRS